MTSLNKAEAKQKHCVTDWRLGGFHQGARAHTSVLTEAEASPFTVPAANHHAAGQASPAGQALWQHVCQGVAICSGVLGDTGDRSTHAWVEKELKRFFFHITMVCSLQLHCSDIAKAQLWNSSPETWASEVHGVSMVHNKRLREGDFPRAPQVEDL